MPEFRYAPQQTDNELLARDMIEDAAHNLIQVFNELAPAEALTRALVHERTEERHQALFWASVYSHCAALQAPAPFSGPT